MEAGSLQLLSDDFPFPEGLRWQDGELWLSDFFSRRVSTLSRDDRVTERAFVPGPPSGLGFTPDGGVLVA